MAVPAAPQPTSTARRSAKVPAGQAAGIEHSRHDDDRRAVLVVVEDRDVQAALQLGFDLEAGRGGDVFQVDASEAGSDGGHGVDERFGRVGVQTHGVGVHSGKMLEEQGLAFHDRQGGQRPERPQTEDGAAIGGDGH